MSAPSEAFVTTSDVATHLKKPESWVYDNAARLDIPRFKVGKHYRYRLSEIDKWVETRRRTLDAAGR